MTPPAPNIVDLEVVEGHQLVAVGASCSLATHRCQREKEAVYRRSVDGGSWVRVASLSLAGVEGSLAVHGSTVWVLAGTQLLRSTDGGDRFAPVSQPCHNPLMNPGADSITDDGTHAYLLCSADPGAGSALKFVYRRDGSRWSLVGKPPSGGDGGTIAAGSDQAIIVASDSAANWLYRSTTAGRRWSTALQVDSGGVTWGDVGFTTPLDGVAVEGPASSAKNSQASYAPGRLLLTDNGGRTWSVSHF